MMRSESRTDDTSGLVTTTASSAKRIASKAPRSIPAGLSQRIKSRRGPPSGAARHCRRCSLPPHCRLFPRTPRSAWPGRRVVGASRRPGALPGPEELDVTDSSHSGAPVRARRELPERSACSDRNRSSARPEAISSVGGAEQGEAGGTGLQQASANGCRCRAQLILARSIGLAAAVDVDSAPAAAHTTCVQC